MGEGRGAPSRPPATADAGEQGAAVRDPRAQQAVSGKKNPERMKTTPEVQKSGTEIGSKPAAGPGGHLLSCPLGLVVSVSPWGRQQSWPSETARG